MVTSSHNYLQAIAYTHGVENDLMLLCKWVREDLFYVLIHDLKGGNDNTMKEEGPLCDAFVKCFLQPEKRIILSNHHIHGASDETMISYLKYLWSKGLNSREKNLNIRKQLSLEKTAVYAALNDAFKTLLCECVYNKVPFPAYETFEDRKRLPRRFFLFFDRFFKSGRHNKELWNAAIQRGSGSNQISFGSCIFEAHVRITIRENYFSWMYQALANPYVVKELEGGANSFITEYDLDDLPDAGKLACGFENFTSSSPIPLSLELVYNSTTKKYNIITSLTQIERIRAEQNTIIQEIIKETKDTRRLTLNLLREMVDEARPNYTKFKKEERNNFNMEAKRKFKLFMEDEEHREDAVSIGSSNKKRKKSPTQNKCRVSQTKLEAFKDAQDKILREKLDGSRQAWEKVYKRIINEQMTESHNVVLGSGLRQKDILLELDDLECNWRTMTSSANTMVESSADGGDGSVYNGETLLGRELDISSTNSRETGGQSSVTSNDDDSTFPSVEERQNSQNNVTIQELVPRNLAAV